MDEIQEAAASNQVRAMPTFLLFKDGEKAGEVVGVNATALKVCCIQWVGGGEEGV